MAPIIRILRYGILKSLAVICALIFFAQPTRASLACPVMMFDGKADQGELSLTFMNRAKVPIRQVEFYCAPLSGTSARRTVCGVETGVFYPGTPYSVRFSYPNMGARTVVVSLRSAQLSEGYMWTSTHDQACRPLRIHAKGEVKP